MMAGTELVHDVDTTTERRLCPLYRVLLHNDDVNTMLHVIRALRTVFGWGFVEAERVMLAAHQGGVALCGVWPLEWAEVYQFGLHSYGLTATVEPEQ